MRRALIAVMRRNTLRWVRFPSEVLNFFKQKSMDKKKEKEKGFIYMVNEFMQVIRVELVKRMIEEEQDTRLEISRQD